MLKRFRACERGVAGIEFALVVPFMIIGAFGTFEAGRLIRAATRMDDAAEMLADIVAQQTSVSSSSMTNFCNGAMLMLSPLPTTTFQAAVASVTYSSSSSSRATDWQDDTCGSATAMTNQVTLATSLTPNAGDSAIVVTATYTYTLSISLILAKTFTITRVAYARPRAGTTITHS